MMWKNVAMMCCLCASVVTTALAEERHEPVKPPATKPAGPAVKEGTWTGKVTEKGADWIRVLNGDGKSERFTPQWVGGMPPAGGLDKAMVAKIQLVKVGSAVKIKWVWNERMRVVELTVTAPPAEAPREEPRGR
jgi:hypothetical protein